jgi:hypothetical protein
VHKIVDKMILANSCKGFMMVGYKTITWEPQGENAYK